MTKNSIEFENINLQHEIKDFIVQTNKIYFLKKTTRKMELFSTYYFFSSKTKRKSEEKNTGQCLPHKYNPVCEKSAISEQNVKFMKIC